MKKNLIIISSLLLMLAFLYVGVEILVPSGPVSTAIEIEIPKGTTFRKAADILLKERLISDRNLFIVLGRLTGSDRKIKAGYYSLSGSMSPLDIFRTLRRGQIIEYEVTIVEGDSLFEIADKLANIGIVSAEGFLKFSRNNNFLANYDIDSQSIEGYIFPDTYRIPKGIRPEDAVGGMINRMREKYNDALFSRTVELGMTENQVLTLASIIEKEAVIDSERFLISAVYHNRLKKKMPLQADPTAVYGIKRYGEKITRSDLLRKTPYNTYIVKGLPPGPIASPGLKSIEAALYPADVTYLFFVSRDDMTHQFSSTAREHMEAVKQYREWKESLKNQVKEENKDEES